MWNPEILLQVRGDDVREEGDGESPFEDTQCDVLYTKLNLVLLEAC